MQLRPSFSSSGPWNLDSLRPLNLDLHSLDLRIILGDILACRCIADRSSSLHHDYRARTFTLGNTMRHSILWKQRQFILTI